MKQKQFAVALYENEAESEDELTFRKNDVLHVLQLDYLGMEGWWLCSLARTGKTGLAAGNRLRLVSDDKTLAKIESLLARNAPSKASSVISSSSSTCSVLSSNSASSSASSACTSAEGSFSDQPRITLPAKLPAKLSQPKPPFLTRSTENILSSIKSSPPGNDDDDYDYDVPANRPVSGVQATPEEEEQPGQSDEADATVER